MIVVKYSGLSKEFFSSVKNSANFPLPTPEEIAAEVRTKGEK
jgi:hypothetical protein